MYVHSMRVCMHVDLLLSYKHFLCVCNVHTILVCRKTCYVSKTLYYWYNYYGNLVWYTCPAWIERTFSSHIHNALIEIVSYSSMHAQCDLHHELWESYRNL